MPDTHLTYLKSLPALPIHLCLPWNLPLWSQLSPSRVSEEDEPLHTLLPLLGLSFAQWFQVSS